MTGARCGPRAHTLLALACVLASTMLWPTGTFAQSSTPPAIVLPPELDRVLRDYESAWRDGDGARLAALFTDDGFAIQSGSPVRRGHADIARGITAPGGALRLTAFAFATSGDVGHIVGGYRYPNTKGEGGRFVLALRKGRDGRWLIAADLDNSGPRP